MKYAFWFLVALTAGVSFYLYRSLDNPFGLLFQGAIIVLLVGFTALFGLAAWRLFITQGLTRKILAGIILLPALFFAYVSASLIVDYRWLIPGIGWSTPAPSDWVEDESGLLQRLKSHPAFRDSIVLIPNRHDVPNSSSSWLTYYMRMAASLRDGHTYVHPLQPAIAARYFPLQGYWFEDGYYIVRAAKSYQQLVGQRIVSINGTSTQALLDSISPLTGSENRWQALSRFDLFVFSADVLQGLGIIPSRDACVISAIDPLTNTKTELQINSEPFYMWAFWALRPISPHELSPAWFNLRKPNYMLEIDTAQRIILVPIHLFNSEKKYSLSKLTADIDSTINIFDTCKIVFDLRNSLGGDNTSYNAIIAMADKQDSATTKFYVLTSRKTFSASVNFISELKEAVTVTIIGEPTGAGPNHYGDPKHIWLPESGISVFISSRKWVFDSTDNRRQYYPDIVVKYFNQDFREKKDPWVEAVKED